GKSILLDALGLVLGDRADTDSIRDGQDKAEITAVFHPAQSAPVWQWLRDHDLDQADACILRRIVSRDNRSRAYINGSPVALQTLRSVGEMLVNIHGQHEHQLLTRADHQRRLLDQHAGNDALLDQLYAAYKAWETADQRYTDTASRIAEREQQLELLRFQLREFDAIGMNADELQTIEADHRRAANAGARLQLAERAVTTLDDRESSVYSQLSAIERELGELAELDNSTADYRDMIASASIQVAEAATGLRSYMGSIDADPSHLNWLDERLGSLLTLARKHHVSLDGLLETEERLRTSLDALENGELTLENLDRTRLEKEAIYRDVANALTQKRKKAAKQMGTAITDAMQHLAMVGGVFDIKLAPKTSTRPSVDGQDDIAFYVSANPGQKPRPLGKVASGGELSRISLAVQLIAAEHLTLETLIFDEVDSGVGGAVAETVGHYLRRLAGTTQVLCVTHLPQVASQAHQHYRVSKKSEKNRTETRLERLSTSDTIDEIARMLGGKKITRQTRDHAREMLNNVED
ncbi:MAG TPA: DNA repair protein RecN, partial [Gammaproteobacteria bacterium]|nr:DNA repair protein RecN [Gammaproteobacteria bacterium]